MDETPKDKLRPTQIVIIALVVIIIALLVEKIIAYTTVMSTVKPALENAWKNQELQGSMYGEGVSFAGRVDALTSQVKQLESELNSGALGAAQAVVNKRLINAAPEATKNEDMKAKWLDYFSRRQEIILEDIKF